MHWENAFDQAIETHQFQFKNLKEMNFSGLKLEIKSTH